MNDKLHLIRKRFPEKIHVIDLLIAEDPEFMTICEDYDACVDAIHYWTGSDDSEAKIKINDYQTLIRELEDEVAQALAVLKLRGVD